MAGEFWQFGLNGDVPYQASGSVSYPYYSPPNVGNMRTCRTIGTISLNTGQAMDQPYNVLLNTFSLGTQLYARLYPRQREIIVNYDGSHIHVPSVRHEFNLILKKGNNEISLGPVGGQYGYPSFEYMTGSNAPLGTFNIFYANYVQASQNDTVIPPPLAFPSAGVGGGCTNRIAMTVDSTGITFWVVGYSSSVTINGVKYMYNTPCLPIGKLTAATLNSKDWFNPTEDGLGEDSVGGDPGGGVGNLPTAPTYPGTDIDFPSLPTGASAFGFSRMALYKPTAAQLGDALDILYSDSSESTLETIIESCKKWWYKPDQYCIGLMLSPVDASTNVSKNIKFGKYDSEVQAACVTDQYQIVDMGNVTVPLQYGSFLDFSGFAACKIFLPFVGFRSLNVDEVMGATIYCKYYVDMLTGSAVAMLKIARASCNSSIYYSFDCNVNVQVPLTANSYAQVVSSIITAGTAAIGTAVTGGLAAGGAAAVAGGLGVAGHGFAADLTQSGNLSSNNGVLGSFTPYICVEFPVASQPSNFNTIKGKPSDIYTSLNNVSGFTVVDQVHLDGINTATDEEVKEIEAMLKSGVIF